ncbi:response regulator [Thaumasiovibrio subtropicus]|uniref:response regulator n=1 Tax=Thaumasiovibrio subtropicus TaxID=1891207 RepID=UPI000B363EE8|nr:response regulator [Thaumasiovibrio subtropicus]
MAKRAIITLGTTLTVGLALASSVLLAGQQYLLHTDNPDLIAASAIILTTLFGSAAAYYAGICGIGRTSISDETEEVENPRLFLSYDGQTLWKNRAMASLVQSDDVSLSFAPLKQLFDSHTSKVLTDAMDQLTISGQQTEQLLPVKRNEHVIHGIVKAQLIEYRERLVYHIEIIFIEALHQRISKNELQMSSDLQEQSLALKKHKQLLKTVINHANFTIIITDHFGRIQTFNPAAEQLLGYSAEDVINRQPAELLITAESAGFREYVERILKEKQPDNGEPHPGKEWHFRSKQGDELPVLMSVSPLLGEHGQLQSLLLIALDMSNRKRYEEALLEAKEVAEQANDDKNSFLASLGHEIRTPMNSILGLSELLQRTLTEQEQKRLNNQVISSAQNLLLMLRDISDLSSIEAGKIVLSPAPFNMDELLQEVASMVIAQTENANVELLFNIDPNIPLQMHGDALRVKQVLLNLLNNALQYTSKGEIILNLAVIEQNTQHCTIAGSVCDTGSGIPKEQQTKIFNIFQQANGAEPLANSGYGLGLAICQHLLTKMGGHISLSSEEGKGSEFFFSMSFGVIESTIDNVQVPSMKVLIVDDYPTARQLTQNMCDGLGWQTTVTNSAKDALKSLGSDRFDAVLVDYSMPEMNGIALCKLIKENSSAIKTILLTSSHYPQLASEIREHGGHETIDGFLTKPITPMQLVNALVSEQIAASPPPVEQASKQLTGIHILLVEDNPTNQAVATELLKEEGASIDLAENGLEALDYLRANERPDIVLMDLQMPVMDGYSATERIRLELGFSDLPIVAMTANALPQDRQACLNVGMNDHVGKPFEIGHLVNTILTHTPEKKVNTSKATQPKPQQVSQATHRPAANDSLVPTNVLLLGRQNQIELESALTRLGGNTEIFTKVMTTFLTDSTVQVETVIDALQQNDHETAGRALHTLKGMAATIGINHLAELAKLHESQFRKTGEVSMSGSDLHELGQQVSHYRDVVENIITDWKSESSTSHSVKRSKIDLALELQCLEQLISEHSDKAKTTYQELSEDLAQYFPEESQTLAVALKRHDYLTAKSICLRLVDKARS